MKVEIIGTWTGKNYSSIVKILLKKNTEITIKVQGKKLIIKDKTNDFYVCIPTGEPVEIPMYEVPVIEDDPVIEIKEEVKVDNRPRLSNEDRERIDREWGMM